MARVLYISHISMTEPLGESQVIQYLLDLAKNNQIDLFSFEKKIEKPIIVAMQRRLTSYNIRWKFSSYSNRFGLISSLSQITLAMCILGGWVKKEKIEIVHARSLVPGIIGLALKKIFRVKLLYDMRGFAIAEKVVEGRLRENSLVTQMLKKIEAYLYKNADQIVTLTHVSKPMIAKQFNVNEENIMVIPTCVNPTLFKKISDEEILHFRKTLDFNAQDFIVLHHGSLNPWVDFTAEVILFKALYKLNTHSKFLILNNGQNDQIIETLIRHSIPGQSFKILSIPFHKVFYYLSIANISLFFIKPSFAKQASAPTKFAENIACHLCSVTNTGYGDMAYYFNLHQVGILLDLERVYSDAEESAQNVLEFFKHNTKKPEVFYQLLENHFSKKIAVNRYQQLYDHITP